MFWRYCRCTILACLPENAYSGLFLAILGDFEPLNCDIGVLTPNVIQRSYKDALWDITCQNWSSGLAPSWAKELTKKHRLLTFHPFMGVTPKSAISYTYSAELPYVRVSPDSVHFFGLYGRPGVFSENRAYVRILHIGTRRSQQAPNS